MQPGIKLSFQRLGTDVLAHESDPVRAALAPLPARPENRVATLCALVWVLLTRTTWQRPKDCHHWPHAPKRFPVRPDLSAACPRAVAT